MILKLVNKTEEAIISLLLVAMTLLVFWEVILRFGFSTGVSWAQEATLHLSAWFVLFGVSYVLKVGGHIGVDGFVKLFPPAGQRLISLFAVVLALVYCGLFLYGSWVYLDKMFLIGIELEDIPVPTWGAHGILLVGLGFLSMRLLILLWRIFRGEATGFPKKDEAEESLALAEPLKAERAVNMTEPSMTEKRAAQ